MSYSEDIWKHYKKKLTYNIDKINTDEETEHILNIMKCMLGSTKVVKKSMEEYFCEDEYGKSNRGRGKSV